MAKKRVVRKIPSIFDSALDDFTVDVNHYLSNKGTKKKFSKTQAMELLGSTLRDDGEMRLSIAEKIKLKGKHAFNPLRPRKNDGNVQDIGFGMVIMFVSAVVALFLVITLVSMNSGIQAADSVGSVGKDVMQHNADNLPKVFDGTIVFMLVGIIGGIAGLATIVSGSPAFAFIGMLIVGMYIFIGAILSNIFELFADNPAMASAAAKLPFTVYLMSKFPLVILMIALIVITIFYAKRVQ